VRRSRTGVKKGNTGKHDGSGRDAPKNEETNGMNGCPADKWGRRGAARKERGKKEEKGQPKKHNSQKPVGKMETGVEVQNMKCGGEANG